MFKVRPPLRLAAFCAIAAAACQQPSSMPDVSYPSSPTGSVVDDYFGTKVADPYRWMEALDSSEVRAWVSAQNAVTFKYLEALPLREHFRTRITELWNYPRVSVPVRSGCSMWPPAR